MSEKNKYRVKLEGWLMGHYRQVGDIVEMSEDEAKYEMHKVEPAGNRQRSDKDARPAQKKPEPVAIEGEGK